ncbi:Na(+)/H(+) antiporter subunit B [Varunaivibrio sulfuroxidans]|uniref:Multisubunit sodium/proton antiporter MrpB subunit n=1 Tax=Varunaivibrio sulfuroxidans TaxID=1773489 RepID=A0A4R3JDZ1_9PROT|nr:Na(+)/H(+) antiporter subunit B [Varunaivibrio sulfuroxidans]TCS64072.1 multisubunit sodium/proton antiporter MrpB subunit [Varunaivibrio sulfuroxidans]WES31477.1 Na(+)/H(+) antiporter subunit B [Varunaivibrio sulfuroxidans]
MTKPDMMHNKSILRVVSKLLIPPIMLFALYVQFHGDYGPGGGFQAGVILASGFILYGIIFGVDTARKVLPAWATRTMLAVGLMIYGSTGLATLIMGGNYLDYTVLTGNVKTGQELGIFLVEFGVGTTVTAAMTTIFFTFAGQREDDEGTENPTQ